jgi:uncharacterized protein YjiS (DUF1127 family)
MRFLHRCGATLLLFICRNFPILGPVQASRRRAGNKRKRLPMFANIVHFVRKWNRYNRSMTELSRLGDRELADIGISRSDIQRVAWKAAYQK